MVVGEFYETLAVRTATQVTAVIGGTGGVPYPAPSANSIATRTATPVYPIVSGSETGTKQSYPSVATRTATDPSATVDLPSDLNIASVNSVATRTATTVVPIYDDARTSTNSIATRTATSVTPTFDRRSPCFRTYELVLTACDFIRSRLV